LDNFLMRLMDLLLAFPPLVLALGIVAVLGPNLYTAMAAVGIVNVPGVARLARSLVLKIKEVDYVESSRALGASELRVLRSCVLPGLISPVVVYTTLLIGRAILTTASLSFLGMGASPPTPEWGAMLADARDVLLFGKWWVAAFPGLAIMALVLGLNLMGDGISEAADPRLWH
jgi:peptide/nickel transport system permease protein